MLLYARSICSSFAYIPCAQEPAGLDTMATDEAFEGDMVQLVEILTAFPHVELASEGDSTILETFMELQGPRPQLGQHHFLGLPASASLCHVGALAVGFTCF